MVGDAPLGVYLDASALVKLVISESESVALRRFLSRDQLIMSSRIATVEVRRVASRQQERDTTAQVDMLLEGILFVEVDEAIALAAGMARPASMRSLDAIHLVSAQSVASEVTAFITYDRRLADAARAAGLTVVAPE